MNAADFYQLLYQTPFASTNARQRAWPFRMSRVNPEAICIGGDAGANTSPTQEPPMQATFYCHWCQSYKPVSTGYAKIDCSISTTYSCECSSSFISTTLYIGSRARRCFFRDGFSPAELFGSDSLSSWSAMGKLVRYYT